MNIESCNFYKSKVLLYGIWRTQTWGSKCLEMSSTLPPHCVPLTSIISCCTNVRSSVRTNPNRVESAFGHICYKVVHLTLAGIINILLSCCTHAISTPTTGSNSSSSGVLRPESCYPHLLSFPMSNV